ncbi:MAG: hypothetical protein ACYDD1_19330 [Caulobacteraceae bacterium]
MRLTLAALFERSGSRINQFRSPHDNCDNLSHAAAEEAFLEAAVVKVCASIDGDHELRCEPRYNKSHSVSLVFGSDLSLVIQARIENRSEKGALLIVNRFATLPPRFLIVDRTDSLFDLARVAWRRDEKCGVMLVRNFDLSKADAPTGQPQPATTRLSEALAVDC